MPTFIIDWPALISIGVIFGYGINGTPAGSVMRTRAYLSGKVIVTLFILLVYYSYRLAPDWMFMYFARGADVPHWLVLYILLLYYFAYDVGFFLKFELAKWHRSFALLFLALTLGASVLVVLPLKDRYLRVGTAEEFQVGQGVALKDSPVGRVPGGLSVVLIPLGIILLGWSRRQKF